MKYLRRVALLAIVVCLTIRAVTVFAQSENQWRRLEQCPVLVETVVEVPALESGVLKTLNVKLNEEVARSVAVAKLDSELIQMDLEQAQLQAKFARNLAADDSDVNVHEFAMQQAKQEYENHERVSGSVSGTELKRLNLAYEESKAALVRAKRTKIRAGVEAELKQARVRAAQLKLERRDIVSPFDGVISKIIKRPGQWVEAGQPIVEMKDLENLQVDCFIHRDAVDLAALSGAQARVEIEGPDSKPVYLAGRLTSYDREVSGQGLVRAHVSVKNLKRDGHWLLLPGMSVTLLVNTTEPLLQAKVPVGGGTPDWNR